MALFLFWVLPSFRRRQMTSVLAKTKKTVQVTATERKIEVLEF